MSSTPVEIYLEYRRVGLHSTGRFFTKQGEVQSDIKVFEKLAFDTMIYALARILGSYDVSKVHLLRTDREGCLPYTLDPGTIELIRVDPVAAVRALSHPGSPSTLALRAQQERTPTIPAIRVGYDVLADAFGTRVYARLLNGDLECPGCGFWSPLEGDIFRCKKRCHIQIPVEQEGAWASVRVGELLASPPESFYLPRRWNTRAWITRVELDRLYSAFITEKEKATCSILETPPT